VFIYIREHACIQEVNSMVCMFVFISTCLLELSIVKLFDIAYAL